MALVFHFPDVGEGIHEGRVVEWLVAEGSTVAEDEALVKVETDKAVVELPSPRAGVVLKIHTAADATIEVGEALVRGEETPQPPGQSKTREPSAKDKTPKPPGKIKTQKPPGQAKTSQPPGRGRKPAGKP